MKNPETTLAQSSTFARWGRWLFTWRHVKGTLIVLAWVGTAIALFYAEENWRGRRAWNTYRRQLEAQDMRLDFKSFIPKPVPDDQNFAQTPALAPLFDFEPGSQQRRDKEAANRIQTDPPRYQAASAAIRSEAEPQGDWVRGISVDLLAWQRAFRDSSESSATNGAGAGPSPVDFPAAANAVLEGLSEFDPLLDELRVAVQRRDSRFNIRYEEENSAAILLPHLAVLKRIVRTLQLRASAELALNQGSRALEDLNLAFQVADAIKEEPILISCLVRISELQLILQPIWQGMADQKWSEPQLAALQRRLQTFDFLAEAKRGLEADRAGLGNGMIEYVRRSPRERAAMVGMLDEVGDRTGSGPCESLAIWLSPSGWMYHEQVEYNRIFQEQVLPLIDLGARCVAPDRTDASQGAIDQQLQGDWFSLFRRHRLFSRLLLPALASIPARAARGQTFADLAVVACGLERFHLAKGDYPAALEDLTPQFLDKVPRDVINGQPLRYRLENGRFVLYSVAWNQKDDGGEFPPKDSRENGPLRGKARGAAGAGDWVWRYPSKTPPLAALAN